MGTNYYRIPSEYEMENRKKQLYVDITNMDMRPSIIESGFRFLKTHESIFDYDMFSPWDKFIKGTNVHLGKRSGGWLFIWNFHNKKYYSNKEELFNFIRSGRVVDEYGTIWNNEEFIEMALNWGKPDGKFNYDIFIDGLRVSTSIDFC
jgi:hypothetical protein